jgi:hypothetical protein
MTLSHSFPIPNNSLLARWQGGRLSCPFVAFPLVPMPVVRRFIRSSDRNEQIDYPDNERGEQGADYADMDVADDELSQPDDERATEESDDSPSERCDLFAENPFDDPPQYGDHDREHEGAPESPYGKLGNDPSDHHQHDG